MRHGVVMSHLPRDSNLPDRYLCHQGATRHTVGGFQRRLGQNAPASSINDKTERERLPPPTFSASAHLAFLYLGALN